MNLVHLSAVRSTMPISIPTPLRLKRAGSFPALGTDGFPLNDSENACERCATHPASTIVDRVREALYIAEPTGSVTGLATFS